VAASPESTHVSRFDLTADVADVKQYRAGWRILGAVVIILGGGTAILGSVDIVFHYGTWSATQEESLGILVIVGAVIAIAYWSLTAQARDYPTFLTVSEREFTMGTRSTVPPRVFVWDEAKLELGLIDRRGLPAIRQDGKPRHTFAFQAGGRGPWIPIPQQAFEALLHSSEIHGLQVSRRTERAPRGTGTFEEISVRCVRRKS
jgi:hypothetical protein